MTVFVLNIGSSSLKYEIFKHSTSVLQGTLSDIDDHATLIHSLFKQLHTEHNTLMQEISCIGHRIVHGSDKFSNACIITEKVLSDIEGLSDLAPLHNPLNILGVKIAQHYFPNISHIAVFDTAFFHTLPEYAFRYALPTHWYTQYSVRRFGFHGTSHNYVNTQLSNQLQRTDLKVITLHLGNGASMAAINSGVCIDTTMGLTPLEGLIMGTRCGDIDASIVNYIATHTTLSVEKIEYILNHESGLKAIANDHNMQNIEKRYYEKDPLAILAIEMFIYKIKKYIGAFYVVLEGVDAIVLTAGIGENSTLILNKLRQSVQCLNLDDKIYVIATDEELAIAQECLKLHPNA